jgi:hypothetical protein
VSVLDRVRRSVVKAARRPIDGARSPAAASVLELPVRQESSFALLSGRSHALLVTCKRDSGAVPTPVWFAFDGDDRLYVWTEVNAFKAKRLKRNPEALLAPCDVRA